MSDNTKIEWSDATWNFVTGCTEVSAGCDHCYAKTFAERWRGTPGHHFENGFDLTVRDEVLSLPLRWRKPRRVFVNSMSDLFHAGIPARFIAQAFAVMAVTPRHTYQILTKRHARMRSVLVSSDFRLMVAKYAGELSEDGDAMHDYIAYHRWPLPNIWLGVSVENQQWADIRIPALLDTPAAVKFLSCEPLLGPIDLAEGKYLRCGDDRFGHECRGCTVDWVIVGGESGPGARPMHPSWARNLRDQCISAGTPFFFKQWGAHRWVEHCRYDQPTQCWVADGIEPQRVSKKLSGRELDGRTWDEFPEPVTAGAA